MPHRHPFRRVVALAAGLSLLFLVPLSRLSGQIVPLAGACGTVPGNPCHPGANISPALQGPFVLAPESGPHTYTFAVGNNGNTGGQFDISCTPSSPQTTCAASPASFHLMPAEEQTVQVSYSVLGLGTYSHALEVYAAADESPGLYVEDFQGVFTVGTGTVAGAAIVSHVWPANGMDAAVLDTLVATYWHPTGINLAASKLWIDGRDSTIRLTGNLTASGYRAPLHPANGYHEWTSLICANNGRCDSVSTVFSTVGPTSLALDDSLPPTVNPLGSGALLGPLNPPPEDLQGCGVDSGDPEIAFMAPLGHVTQPSPAGRVYIATTDTSHPYLTIRTQTLAWLQNKSTICQQFTMLQRTQFNYAYFASAPATDPHWATYPYGDLGAALLRHLDAFTGDPIDLAMWRPSHGPRRPDMQRAEVEAPSQRVAGPRRSTQASRARARRGAMLPDPGPIDSTSWRVELNGVVIINNSQAVGGSGVIGLTAGRLIQSAQVPLANPNFHTGTNGGWNELVASISDTAGRTTRIRVRFVSDAPATPGGPAPLVVVPQRDFTHLDQGECAASGLFQCEGIMLAFGVNGFVSRDRERSLHLVYRSASQKARIPIPLRISIAKTQKAPDSLWVVPHLAGIADSGRITRYAGAQGTVTGVNATNIAEDQDQVRIVASEVDTAGGTAAIRTVRHAVRSWFRSGIVPAFRDDTVSQEVVQLYLTDSTVTRFGQGWQLAELGRLVLTGTAGALQFKGAPAAVWVSGDGSYTVFRKPGGSWVAAPGETARMTQYASPQSDGTLYVLYLSTGASLGFRSDGWQLWSKDLLGNATRYKYNVTSTRLDSIVDPTGRAMAFTYFATGKRKGYVRNIQVRRSTSRTDTIAVAQLDYDTVSSATAVRLSRFMVIRGPAQVDTTRVTYKSGAPGAFVDSIVDPRHTVSKPVVTRLTWDAILWAPESVTRPLNGVSHARQAWRRSAPRVGYGRRIAGNPLERTIAEVQWVGTFVPFAGPAMDYSVDAFGAPTYVLDGSGPGTGLQGTNAATVRHIVRDSVGQPLRIVSNRYSQALADSVVYQYDALGRVTRVIRNTLEVSGVGQARLHDTLTFAYDSVTLAAGAAWCSRLRSARDAYGGRDTVTYHSTGAGRCLPATITGKSGDRTTFTYANANNPLPGAPAGVRPVKVIDPNGNADSVTYATSSWNTEALIQPMGAVTRAYYNSFGRPDSVVDPMGKRSVVIADLSGRTRFAQVGSGSLAPVTRTTYDRGGLVSEVAVYAGSVEVDTVVPASAQKTSTYYDPLGRTDSVIGPGGRSIAPTGFQARKQSWAIRDGFGNPRWEYPGNGAYVSRIYNNRGQVLESNESQVYPGFSADGERFADPQTNTWWSTMGLVTGKVQSAGLVFKYTYDPEGRVITSSSRDPFRPDTAYNYRSYTYSTTGQLRSEKVWFGDVGSADVRRWFYYNRRGQRTLVVDTVNASGVTAERVGRTEYTYDSTSGRLKSIVGRVGAAPGTVYDSVAFTYDSGGREVQRKVYAGGPSSTPLTTTTVHDALGRVAGIASVGVGTQYSASNATYNLVGDLLNFTSQEPGASAGWHQYGYSTDGTRRLLTAVDGALSHVWSYDAYGNRLTEVDATSIAGSTVCPSTMNMVHDSDNRVLRRYRAGGPTGACPLARYYSDQAGRRLGERDTTWASPPYGGLKSVLTYTASGKLYFSVTPSGDLTKNDFNWHWYDAEGRRVISQLASLNYLAPFPHPDSVSGYRTYYVYDGSDVAMELVRTGGTWRVDRRFLSGGLDRPIGGRLFTGTTYQNIVFVTDRGGSVINALDSAGAGVTNPAYFPRNAFGALAGVTGSGGVPLGGVGFAGAGTPNARGGFVYLRNRWYDPQTGRFLTQDPIGLAGGVNLDAYAGNNPISFSDPFGLCTKGDPGCPLIEAVGGLLRPVQTPMLIAATIAVNLPTFGAGEALTLVEFGGAAKAVQVGIAANRARGLAAEAQVARQITAEGGTILGSHVGARTSQGLRVIDHLVQQADGTMVAVEVKSGGAVRSALQLAKDGEMATKSATLVGKNAPAALRGQAVVLPTIEVRVP